MPSTSPPTNRAPFHTWLRMLPWIILLCSVVASTSIAPPSVQAKVWIKAGSSSEGIETTSMASGGDPDGGDLKRPIDDSTTESIAIGISASGDVSRQQRNDATMVSRWLHHLSRLFARLGEGRR